MSISGNTSGDVLQRFESEMNARYSGGECMVIFAIGTNDSSYRKSLDSNQIPVHIYEENMSKLISLSQQHTDKVVCIGLSNIDESVTQPVSWNADIHYTQESIEQYNQSLQKVCDEMGGVYICIKGVLDIHTDLDDGLHPNTQGHRKVYEKVKDFLSIYI